MSKARRGRLSSSSRVVPVFMLTLGISLSLIITSSNTQQYVFAQQGTGVHQNNATKVIGKNSVATTMLNSQQKSKLGSIASSASMMPLPTTNASASMTGSSDMMGMMNMMMGMMNMMMGMMNMMMPSMSMTGASSNSSGMMANSVQGNDLLTMMGA